VSEEDCGVFINLRRRKKLIFKRESKENPIPLLEMEGKKKKKRPPKRIRRRKTTKYIYIYIYIYILYYFLSHNFLPIFVSWFVGEALEPHLSTGGARNFFLSFSPQN
jgi:hypothetical protein